MKNKLLFVQMLLAAVAIHVTVVLNQGLVAMFRDQVVLEGIDWKTALLNLSYINYYIIAILTVCAIGIFGVLMTQVTRRKKELAVHVALGATVGQVFKIVLISWNLKSALLPVLMGYAGSSAVIIVLLQESEMPFGFPLRLDPISAVVSLLCILAFVELISLYPAIRATRLETARILTSD